MLDVNEVDTERILGEILGHVRGVPTTLNEHKGALDTLRAEYNLVNTRLGRVELRQTEARHEARALEERVRALETQPRVRGQRTAGSGESSDVAGGRIGVHDLTLSQRLYAAIPILLILVILGALALIAWR